MIRSSLAAALSVTVPVGMWLLVVFVVISSIGVPIQEDFTAVHSIGYFAVTNCFAVLVAGFAWLFTRSSKLGDFYVLLNVK